jgi:hypothetical protein
MYIECTVKEGITLTNIRLGFVCNKCFNTWAVYLKNDKIPYGGDVCKACSNKETVDNEHNKDISHK